MRSLATDVAITQRLEQAITPIQQEVARSQATKVLTFLALASEHSAQSNDISYARRNNGRKSQLIENRSRIQQAGDSRQSLVAEALC